MEKVVTPESPSETKGRSVRPGEKARQKFSSTGGKAPGYRTITVKRMLAPDWAQKMLCIVMPNRRTVYSEFVSSYTTAIISLQLPCSFTGPTDCPWISEDAPE